MRGGPTPPSSPCADNPAQFIDQLDGNISFNSSMCSNKSENDCHDNLNLQIPTQTGYRPSKVIYERPPNSGKTIRRDNRIVHAQSLPKMSNYNMRALFSKIGNFSRDMHERSCDLSFLTEVWEKLENKKHQFRLEELLEISGIKYISTPRPGAQRGGGAAIAVRLDKFTLSKLNIALPKSVEVVWGLMKP